MENNTTFKIDGIEKVFSIKNTPEFKFGKDQILSTKTTDITFDQPWYQEGFTEKDFLNNDEFNTLKTEITKSVENIIKDELAIDTTGFDLENYHKFVTNDDDHFKVIARSRDFFSDDFSFSVKEFSHRLSDLLGFELSDIDPDTQEKMFIIVRINRPSSNDYNPPHKDIYQGFDNQSYIPQYVNFWIPIAGATAKTNLPLAPRSHHLNEKLIERTFEGGKIEGNQYRVRMVKSWDGNSDLYRSKVKYGQTLIFSSHLIHGLAVNEETDKTRVALEFRLFKAQP